MDDLKKLELRRLAEAAPHKDWWAGNAYDKKFIADYQVVASTPEGNYVLLEGNQNFLDHAVANAAFVGACSPSAILALLDELAKKCSLLDEYKAGGRNALEMLEDAEAERDQLRADIERQTELRRLEWNRAEALQAEVDRLRKDAARWRLVRSPIGTQSALAVWHEGRMPVFSKIADRMADEAIAKEAC